MIAPGLHLPSIFSCWTLSDSAFVSQKVEKRRSGAILSSSYKLSTRSRHRVLTGGRSKTRYLKDKSSRILRLMITHCRVVYPNWERSGSTHRFLNFASIVEVRSGKSERNLMNILSFASKNGIIASNTLWVQKTYVPCTDGLISSSCSLYHSSISHEAQKSICSRKFVITNESSWDRNLSPMLAWAFSTFDLCTDESPRAHKRVNMPVQASLSQAPPLIFCNPDSRMVRADVFRDLGSVWRSLSRQPLDAFCSASDVRVNAAGISNDSGAKTIGWTVVFFGVSTFTLVPFVLRSGPGCESAEIKAVVVVVVKLVLGRFCTVVCRALIVYRRLVFNE